MRKTGNIRLNSGQSHSPGFGRVPVFVILAAVVTCVWGYWLFVGWRARDLALKARANLESANYRFAWLQAASARDLRADEPEVLRTSALVDAAFGRKTSMDAWRRLAWLGKLSLDDQEQRARAAIRFGDQAQFESAVTALEAAGRKDDAVRLRTAELVSRGDLEKAVDEARRGAASSNDPRLRLDLARLLLRRYSGDLSASPAPGSPASRAFEEMTSIVNALQSDPSVGQEALAFGLTYLLAGRDTQMAWATRAMSSLEPDNPALLPAATVLVDIKAASAEDMHKRLRSIFAASSLTQRSAYAAWLTSREMPQEALAFVETDEAVQAADPFLARADALGKLNQWELVLAMTDAAANVPAPVRLLTRARAEYALRPASARGAKAVADALRAAFRQGDLATAVRAADEFGARDAVDAAVVELCGDPDPAGGTFRVARERFSLAGRDDLLHEAFTRAAKSSADALPVKDFARYSALLAGGEATPEVMKEAEEDSASDPSDTLMRVTRALVCLRAGRPEEALATFGNITVFYDRLPPGPQAVVCAVLDANGRRADALALAKAIDISKISPAERALLQGLR